MVKKSILLCSVLVTVSSTNQVNMQNYLDNTKTSTGEQKEFVTEYQDATKIDAAKGFFNYKEVVYSRIVGYRNDISLDGKFAEAKVVNTFDVVDYQEKKQQELDKKLAEQQKTQEEIDKKITVVAQGYCRFRNEVQVTKLSEYSYLDCEFNDIGKASLAVLIVPDFYAKALVAQPLYISYSDEFGKEQRLNTTGGAVLNATKSSINIANVVNDYLLEKILASTAYQGATIATNQAKAYLDAKSEARKKEEVNYISTGDGTVEAVKSTNIDKPEKADYITGAFVELVSSLVKNIGSGVLSSINYAFKINKNAVVFADIVVSSEQNYDNNGGIIKKTKLINKGSKDVISPNGEYNFTPEDAGLEIELMERKNSGSSRNTNQGQ